MVIPFLGFLYVLTAHFGHSASVITAIVIVAANTTISKSVHTAEFTTLHFRHLDFFTAVFTISFHSNLLFKNDSLRKTAPGTAVQRPANAYAVRGRSSAPGEYSIQHLGAHPQSCRRSFVASAHSVVGSLTVCPYWWAMLKNASPCPAAPCPATPRPALPCPASPRLASPCPALPCLALPRLALPRLASPCPAPPCRARPRPATPSRASPRPALPCHASPCLISNFLGQTFRTYRDRFRGRSPGRLRSKGF